MKIFLGLLLVLILVSGGLTGCASAEFEVSQLTITPSQVATGEDFTVSAEITNVGDADGIYTATLTVNNIERATRDITVAAGMTEIVSFTLTEENSGSYNIALNDMTVLLRLPSVDEIVDDVIQALYGVDTYQYDMEINMNIAGVVDDEEGNVTIYIDSSGTVDNINRRMWIETVFAIEMTIPEEEEMVVGMEMYLIGNDAYMLIEAEDETLPWVKERMPVGSWSEMAKVDSEVALLETAEVTLIGSEKIRGIDCHVLQMVPDEEKLFEMISQEASIQGEQLPILTEELFEELIKNALVKQWVGKDTFFPAKMEVVMEAEVTPDIVGDEGEGTLTVKLTMTSFTFNYNKSVNIELPTEAEEAISWESDGYSEAAETELANVQAAVHAMMVDNELAWLPNPVTVATNDMSAFPDATSVCGIDKLTDYYGNPYKMNFDKDGYILYQHDITGDGAQIGLVNYLASQYTTYWYYVDAAGTVTQVPTSAPETAPDVVQEKVKDIESIMDRAEGLGIHVEAVAHEGEIMTITCQADDYTTFRDYLIALEESGRFSMVAPPSESFSYITGGTIELEPKYQYMDMPAVYYEVNLALAPMTASDAIAILVGIAEGSGIDIDPNVGKLRIAPATIRQVKAAGNTYQVLSFRNIQLQGDYEDVMAFISDLDSRKTLRTMILTRVVIIQIEDYDKIETAATVDVDIYTIES